jgi:dCMP deaminase
MTNWDHRFMALAMHIATWSKDRTTKVGCVIVGSVHEIKAIGYNGFVRGANDTLDERHQRPAKYDWTEHAERNAIYQAARLGISLSGSKMYLPWFPCIDCARAIVQVGISELIAYQPDMNHERWGTHFANSTLLFEEAGVKVRFVSPLSAQPGVSESTPI